MGQRVGAAALDATPRVRKVRIQGQVYSLRELTIGEYDALEESSKVKRPNPVTGLDEETTDRNMVLRKMVSKSTGLSLAKLDDLPMGTVVTLNGLVNDMHFPPTDAGAKGALWEAVEDEEEEEAEKTGEG